MAKQQMRARNPRDAFWTLDPFAVVRPTDPWYAGLDQHFDRGRYGLGTLRFLLTPSEVSPEFMHVAVVGHNGCGKSTEVRRIMTDVASHGRFPVYVDVLASLDQTSLSFADFLLIVVRCVLEALDSERLTIPADLEALVRLWFSEEILSEIHSKEIAGSVEAELSAKGGVPFLARLMGKVTAVLRSDNVYRREIRSRAERDVRELVRRVSHLLDAASSALTGKFGKAQTVAVVFENLEKVEDLDSLDKTVILRADEIRELRCHLVLFLPPALEYSPVTTCASNCFPVAFLPMLPVRSLGDDPEHVSPRAVAAVRAMLGKRLDLDAVFTEPDEVLTSVTRLSGGRLRDVFHLTRGACERVAEGKVSAAELEAAADEISARMCTNVRPGDWSRLAEIHSRKKVERREDDAHLLRNRLVLDYDGKPWWDVHPLVRRDERFGEAWAKVARITAP